MTQPQKQTYPPGPATLLAQELMLEHTDPLIMVTTADRLQTFYLSGGLAPWPRYQDGLQMVEMTTPTPEFKNLYSQGARQDGRTYGGDTVYDAMQIDGIFTATATTPEGLSQVVSDWIAVNDPEKLCRLEWLTFESGLWWCDVRLDKRWVDRLQQSPRRQKKQVLSTVWSSDMAFWASVDSTCVWRPGNGEHLSLTNIGDRRGWPQIVFEGPGLLELGNGPGVSEMIKFGPLLDGQRVLISTHPRYRAIVDLTTAPVGQQLDPQQKLIDMLVKLISMGQVPPALQWLESVFGIKPPQGVLYSLLEGRFTRPIPGVPQPSQATTSWIAVKVTGGNDNTKVTASLTPMRRWPE